MKWTEKLPGRATVFLSKWLPAVLFVLIVLVTFAFRNSIAERDLKKLERAAGGQFAPYLVESAIMYDCINRLADGEDIAQEDPDLPAMRGVPAAEQMSLSLEYAGGGLLKIYRLLHGSDASGDYERSYRESRFLRYCTSWYIALVPALLFLALCLMKVPWPAALGAVLLETFSAAALGRYSGQDLIKGVFALPILSGYAAAYAAALYGTCRQRKWGLIAALITAAAAYASWDASQIVIGLLAAAGIIRNIVTNRPERKLRDFYLLTFIGMTAAALLVPYHRAHGSFFSPVLLLALPGAITLNMLPGNCRRYVRCGVMAGLGGFSYAAAYLSPFCRNYEHFSSLLWAKLRFFNTLPGDPALLSFDQRYLWTPELHSADWGTLRMIFPAILWVLVILYSAYLFRKLYLKKINCHSRLEKVLAWEAAVWLMLTAAALVLCIFMLRFRDLTVFFAVMAMGVLLRILLRKNSSVPAIVLLALLLAGGIAIEWRNSRHLRRGYPEGMQQTALLIKHLRQYDLRGRVFLGDMYNSTLLKGYTDAAILIQAKYELPAVRHLTCDYILKFFNAPLDEFADFCAVNQVDYLLVHVPMVTTPANVPYSYRYIANAAKLKRESAAVKLALERVAVKNFYELSLPESICNINGYRLYKFISPERLKKAEILLDKALESYYLGQHVRARKMIRRAYVLAPGMSRIYEAYTLIHRQLPPQITLPRRRNSASVQH